MGAKLTLFGALAIEALTKLVNIAGTFNLGNSEPTKAGTCLLRKCSGSKDSPAYHGQATLSKWTISKPRLIRFSRQSHFWQPRWFLPKIEPFQERLGGRIALVAQINVAGSRLMTYNLHLESRGSDALRISQLGEVLSDTAGCDIDCPVIVAGDLNRFRFAVHHSRCLAT